MKKPHHIAPNRNCNMIGRKFGRLIVLELDGKTSNCLLAYKCRCECGTVKTVCGSCLRRGLTKSCGCLLFEGRAGKDNPSYIHGLTNSQTYRSWANMIQRCTNPHNHKWPRYGGRGIKICAEWMVFANFLRDMGPSPAGFSIERKDVNGDYEKSNCCWLHHPLQGKNKTNHRLITFNGMTKPFFAWAEHLGISYGALRQRLQHGWSIERALTQPQRVI